MNICRHGSSEDCQRCYHIGQIERFINDSIDKVFNNCLHLSLELVGKDSEGVYDYLAGILKPGMTWGNYGQMWTMGWKIPLMYNKPGVNELVGRFNYQNLRCFWR